MEISTRWKPAAFALLILIWGLGYPMIKIGLEYAPPILFAGIRTLLGGFIVAIVAYLWGGAPHFKRHWRHYLILAILNVMLYNGLSTFSLFYLPSGVAAILLYVQPIVVSVLAWQFAGESFSVQKGLGLICGFAGVVSLSLESLFGGMSFIGVAVSVIAAISWAMATVYFKVIQNQVSTLWTIAWQFLIGGTVLSLLGFSMESWSQIDWTGAFWTSLLYQSCAAVALAWVLWLGLIRAGEAGRVASLTFLIPLVSVAIGLLFLDERLTPSLFIGAALVVSGVYLVNRQSQSGADQEAEKSVDVSHS